MPPTLTLKTASKHNMSVAENTERGLFFGGDGGLKVGP